MMLSIALQIHTSQTIYPHTRTVADPRFWSGKGLTLTQLRVESIEQNGHRSFLVEPLGSSPGSATALISSHQDYSASVEDAMEHTQRQFTSRPRALHYLTGNQTFLLSLLVIWQTQYHCANPVRYCGSKPQEVDRKSVTLSFMSIHIKVWNRRKQRLRKNGGLVNFLALTQKLRGLNRKQRTCHKAFPRCVSGFTMNTKFQGLSSTIPPNNYR